MLLAKAMMALFVGIALLSIAMLIRSLYRPLEATTEKLAAMKRVLWIVWRFLFGAVGMAAYALISKQYYLLLASAFFVILVLPILVRYLRLKSALKAQEANLGNA
jgi:hypothetical protein